MPNTANLSIAYLQDGQAQKHVTVNEALKKLDALVQLAVVSATTSAQPGSPVDGQAYILPAGKTGAQWGAMTNLAIAYYVDGAWMELAPREGWRAYVKDTDLFLGYTGSAWAQLRALNGLPAGGAAKALSYKASAGDFDFAFATQLFWDETNKRLGIGTAAPTAPATINANAAAPPAPLSGSLLHVVGADGAVTRILTDIFGANAQFSFRRANGTPAAPSALLANDQIALFAAFGYGATGYSAAARARMDYVASENWSDAAQGTDLVWYNTPNGSTTLTERLRIRQNGEIAVNANANVIADGAGHLRLRSYTVAGLPSATVAGQLIYVSNGTANKRLAVSDGTNWRWPDGAIVS
ncbi:MAG: DUF2793 domain-containing protein [Hyphomonadaceae bacterium]|nr:DUF2793 domain-containing protein [Hyphomonadaceae bacterium]